MNTSENKLFLILKSEWFYKIKSGQKKIEYRLCNDYWKKRLENKKYDYVVFQKGYSNKERIIFEFISCEIVNLKNETFSDLEVKVFAIKLGKEIK